MKRFLPLLCICVALSGCGSSAEPDKAPSAGTNSSTTDSTSAPITSLEKIDMSKWQYNADDNVYYQLNIPYCETPADENYDTLAVIVPAAYLNGEANEDGTYTCTLNIENSINGYTCETAPFVLPVETPGYAAQSEMTEYTSQKDYTDSGFVYVHIGCRGRDAGAPSGVTDMKAGIRYIRYNQSIIPGNTDRIFSFGMSGGGAQSSLLGSTGDSPLYEPYLGSIGAVSGVSDAVLGSMCWCPITGLDIANEAYEWNMGITRSDLDEESKTLSDGLAAAYVDYINSAGLKDKNGNELKLDSKNSGTYYDYVKSAIETSLNNFLADTQFPYDPSASSDKEMGGFGGHGGGMGNMPGGMKDKPDMQAAEKDFTAIDDINRSSSAAQAGVTLSGTYETVQDYINALNANGEWVIYDAGTNTATITSVEDFTKALKPASKSVGAFDDLNRSQGENTLFGYGDGSGAHFDRTEAALLKGTAYESDFTADLDKKDALGTDIDTRINMYTPLYYLIESSDGYKTSSVAKYWRINSGIDQGDTSVTTELDLASALENYPDVKSVEFSQVWGQKHVKAERTGDSTSNFIDWVNRCLSENKETDNENKENTRHNGGRGGNGGMSVQNSPEIQSVIDENSSKFEQLSFEDEKTGITLEYSLYVPENYDENTSYPFIMYIPDSSASGKSAKEIVENYYGSDVWVSEEDQKKHPSFVLVPAFSETVVDDDFNVSDQVEAAVDLIVQLTEKYNIDKNRLYTTGQSMGCMTSLYLNSKYPDMFAASMFVSGQWDISVLKGLENKKFFYITAGGDTKASGGQDEVKAMFDADNVKYTYNEWSAQLDDSEQSALVNELISQNTNANMIRFETGTVLADGSGMEHMASFNYGYKLSAVRDWIFKQVKE